MDNIILEIKGLTKTFPGVTALDQVSFRIHEGEAHALCGENGAGKSTLINILCGVYGCNTYSGDVLMDGKVCRFRDVRDAEDNGIACVHQELALVPEMSVGENIFLNNQPRRFGSIRWNILYAETQKLIKRIGLTTDAATGIDPFIPVKALGVNKQQIVEILKALSKKTRILILDEPTSSLTDEEAEALLGIIRQLRAQGVTCIYISHKLDEVMQIADRITILRDGKSIETRETSAFKKTDVITGMVGRKLDKLFPREQHSPGGVRLEVRDYSVDNPNVPGKRLLSDINLQVRGGEILGLAGLMGAGRTELFSSIYGVLNAGAQGRVFVDGEEITERSTRNFIENGVVLVTEDRKKTGLVLGMSVMENLTMLAHGSISTAGVLNKDKERKLAEDTSAEFTVKTASIMTPVRNLSGGNQQKVVLGKAMLANPKVLILDEPTRGVDVGAKFELYKIMNRLADQGVAIIMISSEMEEILGMSDRIIVFSEGQIRGEMSWEEASQAAIMTMIEGE